MAIIQPMIEVPEDLYARYMIGEIDIMGLAKDSDNGRVVKHLNVVDGENNSDSSANSEAMAAAVILGVVAVAGAAALIINNVKKKKVNEFKESLNAYVEAVNRQKLTVAHIDRLVAAMDKIKNGTRKKLNVSFSVDELAALVECLCNHTRNLAEVNNVFIDENYTEEENNDILLKLRKNLIYQKQILKEAA